MPDGASVRLEVMVSSQMSGARWERLRTVARECISRGGFDSLNFEGLAPGPVEEGLTPRELGIDLARRADMIVAIIGGTVTTPVHDEIQTALDRSPTPPMGVFFDESVNRDDIAEAAREQLRNVTIFGDFTSTADFSRLVSAFLAQKSHIARRNRSSPPILEDGQIVVAPGQEERRRYLLLTGDRITVTAEALQPSPILPRQKFHLAVLSGNEFVVRTATTPYTRFRAGNERFTFNETLDAEAAGYHYVVVRRPWWFQVGKATVRLTVALTHRST